MSPSGAAHVDAVDIDDWADANCRENIASNGVADRIEPIIVNPLIFLISPFVAGWLLVAEFPRQEMVQFRGQHYRPGRMAGYGHKLFRLLRF